MQLIDQGKESERIIAKCKIYGEYAGLPFEAEAENYYWTHDNNDPSTYWWVSGNMACDCNRVAFLPAELREKHNGECGHAILFTKIVPLEGNLPTLNFDDNE